MDDALGWSAASVLYAAGYGSVTPAAHAEVLVVPVVETPRYWDARRPRPGCAVRSHKAIAADAASS